MDDFGGKSIVYRVKGSIKIYSTRFIYKEHMVTIHEETCPLGNKYIYTLYYITYII